MARAYFALKLELTERRPWLNCGEADFAFCPVARLHMLTLLAELLPRDDPAAVRLRTDVFWRLEGCTRAAWWTEATHGPRGSLSDFARKLRTAQALGVLARCLPESAVPAAHAALVAVCVAQTSPSVRQYLEWGAMVLGRRDPAAALDVLAPLLQDYRVPPADAGGACMLAADLVRYLSDAVADRLRAAADPGAAAGAAAASGEWALLVRIRDILSAHLASPAGPVRNIVQCVCTRRPPRRAFGVCNRTSMRVCVFYYGVRRYGIVYARDVVGAAPGGSTLLAELGAWDAGMDRLLREQPEARRVYSKMVLGWGRPRR